MTTHAGAARPGRAVPSIVRTYGRLGDVVEVPNLIQVQLDSSDWFKREGLLELFEEINPIQDFSGTRMELRFRKSLPPRMAEGETLAAPAVDADGVILLDKGTLLTSEHVKQLEAAGLREVELLPYAFGEAKFSERECRDRDMTYAAPLRVNVELKMKESEEIKEQELFFGDFPLMTPTGTFVINGAERVVVSQLVRSPGVYFTLEQDPSTGRQLCFGKLIPNRGAWLEFETSSRNVISVKVDRKRRIPVTTLLRAIDGVSLLPDWPGIEEMTQLQQAGDKQSMEKLDREWLGSSDRILQLFKDVDDNDLHRYIQDTLDKDGVANRKEALLEFYRRMRPGDPPTEENARNLLGSLFFSPRRYDLGRVGRYKVNKRLRGTVPQAIRVLTPEDIIAIVRQMIRINNGDGHADDIDHLGNRRVRAVGELIQNQFRIGLLRMERVVRERMTITEAEQATPSALINIRPVVASMKEFFGGSQLSQFMDQTNPLAELTHKRRLSALGPGGLSRDRAGFDVRDVHHSHYGRICPIETPEGPNIGLIGSLATYGRINEYGFIETPYRRVLHEAAQDLYDASDKLVSKAGDALDPDEIIVRQRGGGITDRVRHLHGRDHDKPKVRSRVSDETLYLSADEEEMYVVGQANAVLDEQGYFLEEKVEVRFGERFLLEPPESVDYMDVSPKQIVSVATSLIPFLEHDDANRALMGSNMQRQAVPLLRPEVPLVGTGMEMRAARDSGQVILAEEDGEVVSATADQIVMRYDSGRETRYPLMKFIRSNQGTCINQRPIVTRGDRVLFGDPLVDSSSTDGGQLALGQSVLCAFMSWEGYNFEDAIIISDRLARDDVFTSIHIEKHEIEARDTKLGPEEITRDIPNVGDESLRDLDEQGIVRIGAEVGPGDILVGKITPKGETELTAEEKLLRAIFGEKAREVKDTSLRVPHGERGKVIEVREFSRAQNNELPAGVNQLVRVSIAQKRKLSEGDKMAGRHGNKGVISRILPQEDMPFLADGTPIDIILNPIGVPSRMNVGQVLETHLGLVARALGFRAVTPVFDGATDVAIEGELARMWLALRAGAVIDGGGDHVVGENIDHERFVAWLGEQGYDGEAIIGPGNSEAARRAATELWMESLGETVTRGLPMAELMPRVDDVYARTGDVPPVWGKQPLYDGRTGDSFAHPVTVGQIYMMKLVHLVEDKIHARSTGPYSLITQQPLGGKAQFGGQRFGEMEVWALEAYGAAHILQELLTVKSDDVVGRVKTYEAIVKGEDVMEPGVPESFKVLVKELQSLGLAVEVLNEDEENVPFPEDSFAELPELGINMSGFEREEFVNA